MTTDNLIVFCYLCGNHFKRNEIDKFTVVSGFEGQEMPKNLYICKTCYEALPKTDEYKKMEVVK